MMDRAHLLTEQRLPESMKLDSMSVDEALSVMNAQDEIAVRAVKLVQSDVGRAIDLVVRAVENNGRLFYFGAGTSGRLGVLDASECPPTFRSDPSMVQGVIAGGDDAMFRAKEGAEDSIDGGARDVDERNVSANDVVIGIAAGGTTPYVHGVLRRASERGAKTIFLTCVDALREEPNVDVIIRPLVGPEVLTGSTRLKAGTATKLILNQITTIAMVQLGKCYENLMVDLRASNTKLRDRAIRIVRTICSVAPEEAATVLDRADGHVKLAVVMQRKNVDAKEAGRLLERANGKLRVAIE